MIFTVDRNLASCVLYNGLETTLQSAVSRNVFLSNFAAPIANDVLLVCAEFDRNLFHVQDENGLHVYETTEDSPIIKFFADNKDQLFNWFTDQENMLQRPSLFHTYNAETHAWTLTAENKILLDAETVRNKRNSLLSQSDWTQAADVPQATKDLWAPYRQALRDAPQQSGFPADIVWPTKPA